MADSETPSPSTNGSSSSGSHAAPQQAPAPRLTRGRYAKFTGSMDVLLLEALREHNPFTAKHGTRLQMWKNIAHIVGEALYQNPEAYTWHTCRDRVTALMKMYADGKHDKLSKRGSDEENARKEAILREISTCIAHKADKSNSRLPAAAAMAASTATASPGALIDREGSTIHAVAAAASAFTIAGGQKRRRLDSSAAAAAAAASQHADGGEVFRARVLALIESKVQFDMEQRVKETELREQEFELQKRFLEYLQSK